MIARTRNCSGVNQAPLCLNISTRSAAMIYEPLFLHQYTNPSLKRFLPLFFKISIIIISCFSFHALSLPPSSPSDPIPLLHQGTGNLRKVLCISLFIQTIMCMWTELYTKKIKILITSLFLGSYLPTKRGVKGLDSWHKIINLNFIIINILKKRN